ncbi:hypothetical protein J7400_11715 [Shimia sp. R9_2]|uniref:hypothetical protein n=1 Tax=Shimia sp. R9_2 TaxID=2821112 RepID=UPI001AD9854F|nr:hypothetical protein [Shimia sp. R9_2]MBO9397349.1 hypothetical protein [Shimia sp. R9_2]
MPAFFRSVLFFFVFTACNDEHNETATIEEGRRVEISLVGLFSLQSDWDRYLTILDGENSIQVELLSDTGWWRGSSLYHYKSDIYVLNEGQGGCVVFQFDPPKILSGYSNLCTRVPRNKATKATSFAQETCKPSRYYADLCFIGLFFEADGAEDALQFNRFTTQSEKLLPEQM